MKKQTLVCTKEVFNKKSDTVDFYVHGVLTDSRMILNYLKRETEESNLAVIKLVEYRRNTDETENHEFAGLAFLEYFLETNELRSFAISTTFYNKRNDMVTLKIMSMLTNIMDTVKINADKIEGQLVELKYHKRKK